MAAHKKVVAIGEIGLDYYYDFSPQGSSEKNIHRTDRAGLRVGLPIIVHNRESHKDVLDILRSNKDMLVGGVMHCYSGSWDMAKLFLDLGLNISLGGPVTFKMPSDP